MLTENTKYRRIFTTLMDETWGICACETDSKAYAPISIMKETVRAQIRFSRLIYEELKEKLNEKV